jgi:glycosyltransferase involved in cell wall biosynthesis
MLCDVTRSQIRKLVQVSATLDPKLGGPVSVVAGLSHQLHKHFDHKLLVFGNNRMDVPNIVLENTIFGNRYGLISSLGSSKFKIELKSADILLIHGYFLFSTLFSLKFSSTHNIFLMPHGSLENYQSKRGKFRKKVFDFFFFKFLGEREITFLLGSNQEVVSVQERFPFAKIKVVGLGISPSAELAPKNILHGEVVQLFCLSRIAAKKRIDLCLQAIKLLRNSDINFHLSIYGSGEKSLENDLRKLAIELEIDEDVEFRGHVNNIERINAFSESHIFLLPSENENFAVAVAESIQSLRPVVISKNVAMHEFVEMHKSGITIEKLSPEDLANGILEVVQNYQNYVSNCKVSRDYLSWDKVFENWLRAINGELN